jgi:hypothetical protein
LRAYYSLGAPVFLDAFLELSSHIKTTNKASRQYYAPLKPIFI